VFYCENKKLKERVDKMAIHEETGKKIFVFQAEERETILRFDEIDNVWHVESSVKKHMTKLLKQSSTVEVDTVNENGTRTSVKGTLLPHQISILGEKKRTGREMTEEEKEKARIRLNELRRARTES
jgi:hypothetical protein